MYKSQSIQKKDRFQITTILDAYDNIIVNAPIESNFQPRVRKKSDWNENLEIPLSDTKKLMNSLFYSHYCKKASNGTKRLCLNGSDLLLRKGRRLNDSDIPGLLIFLHDNSEIVELSLPYNEIRCAGFVNILNYLIPSERYWSKKNSNFDQTRPVTDSFQTDNHIAKLNLEYNEIRSIGIGHLLEDGERLHIDTLKLNGNKIGVESSKQIALMLLKNRYLRHLDVADVDQTASSLVYFTTVLRMNQDRHNDTLKVIDISRPNPECMQHFDSTHFASLLGSMLKNNNCLEKLYLRNFGFSCHDIELILAEGKSNRSLLLLDLSSNNIGDFGVELFANWLKERPPLRGLVLAHNNITSNGARSLSYGLPFSKLLFLDISHNRLSDTGMTAILNTIKKSPCIRFLKVFGNCLGHETAEIVSRMLLSGVLVQKNLDVKPCKINYEWYCARYPSSN